MDSSSSLSTIHPADSDFQVVAMWLHNRPESTQRVYRGDVNRFFQFANKSLPQVTLLDLQEFYDSLKTSTASRQRTLRAVKSLLTFSQRIGYLSFNVGAAIVLRRPKDALASRILDKEAVIRMIALEKNARNRAMLLLLYDSGVRVSELIGLDWQDVIGRDGGCGQITVLGKGSKTRTILVGAKVYTAIRALPSGGGSGTPVFLSKSGGPLDQTIIWRIVRAAARRAGIEAGVSTHWLRHACASHALDGGAPIHLVQQQLGHASLETTTRYSHARPDDGLFRYL